MKIQKRDPRQLVPYENNPRVNDPAIDAVASSILEFGFRQPIVVDEAGVIVCGHATASWRSRLRRSSAGSR